jgi:4-aminobutyrate aminotransferase
MITEEMLATLSYPEAPKMVTKTVPGPKGQAMYNDALKYETPTRVSLVPPLVWEEGLGATTRDPDGNVFIDTTGGIAVANVGRCHPRVVEAVRNQAGKLMLTGGPMDPRSIEVAKKISGIMPEGLRDQCFTAFLLGGSDAIETAMKYARAITGKTQILGFEGAYHGVWFGSMALTTNLHYRVNYGPALPGVFHMPYAYCYRCFAGLKHPGCSLECAKYFDYKLNTLGTGLDDVAAVIVEPMQGEGGYVPPPEGFLKTVKQACEKKGILFIADEVQTGAGRTGKMWSIEHYGIVPDILVWAKGIGGDMPMSGLTVHNRFRDKLVLHSQPSTFAGNAVACAAVSTNIDLLTDKEMDLIGRAAIVGEEIKARLEEAARRSKFIGDVRGKGFFIAMELVKDKETKEPMDAEAMAALVSRCLHKGVRISTCGRNLNVVRFMTPLVITRAHFNKAVDIVLDTMRSEFSDTF